MLKWRYDLTSALEESEWSASMSWTLFPRYVLDRRPGRPQSQPGRCGVEVSYPYWESNSCRQFDILLFGRGSSHQKPFISMEQKNVEMRTQNIQHTGGR